VDVSIEHGKFQNNSGFLNLIWAVSK